MLWKLVSNSSTVLTTSRQLMKPWLLTKGGTSLKQYMSMKPIKRGIKAWVRADSVSGCMCDFNIYEGKDGVQGKGLGHKVVTTLCEELYDKNYWIFCDNFFTSVSLMEDFIGKTNLCLWNCEGTFKGITSWDNSKERGQTSTKAALVPSEGSSCDPHLAGQETNSIFEYYQPCSQTWWTGVCETEEKGRYRWRCSLSGSCTDVPTNTWGQLIVIIKCVLILLLVYKPKNGSKDFLLSAWDKTVL